MRSLVFMLLLGSTLHLQAQNIKTALEASKTDLSILFFYTTWCPACQKAVQLMNEVALRYPQKATLLGINIDDGKIRRHCLEETDIRFKTITLTRREAAEYGVDEGVPVIYLLNQEHKIVKQYRNIPNRALFLQLIDRLQKGFLENGTLPVDKRLDLWKQERK